MWMRQQFWYIIIALNIFTRRWCFWFSLIATLCFRHIDLGCPKVKNMVNISSASHSLNFCLALQLLHIRGQGVEKPKINHTYLQHRVLWSFLWKLKIEIFQRAGDEKQNQTSNICTLPLMGGTIQNDHPPHPISTPAWNEGVPWNCYKSSTSANNQGKIAWFWHLLIVLILHAFHLWFWDSYSGLF